MDICRLNQWVVWRYDGREKVPYSPTTGRKASVTDPSTWGSYEDAELLRDGYWGVGFVFTEDDPYCGIDLDDCIQDGEIQPWAMEIVESLGSCWEISPSGTGIHVYVIANKPGPRSVGGGIEMYDSGHYLTVAEIQHGTIESRQDEIDELYAKVFPERQHDAPKPGEGFQGDDEQLLHKMRNGPQGNVFRKLYEDGNWEFYPSQSEADYHLCCILAYWIGPEDEDRIADWFMSSPLAENIERHPHPDDYLERTIIAAIGSRQYFYDPDFNSATPTARDAITGRRMFVLDYGWAGRSGPTDRDVYRTLLRYAWKYGEEQHDGIRVSVDYRTLTLEAGLGSTNTTRKAVKRLDERHSLVSVLSGGGKRTPATYLLREIDPKVTQQRNCVFYVSGSGQALPLTSKIRNAGPNVGTIGKRNGQIIDLVDASREPVPLDKLAAHLNVRKNHLKARNIKMLLDEGFLVGDEQGYETPPDIEQRLRTFLEESGSNDAEQVVKTRIDNERKAYNEQKEQVKA